MTNLDSSAQIESAGPSAWKAGRRSLVKGSAWAVPTILVGAPAARAGFSGCDVEGSLQIASNQILNLDAVCANNSQSGNLNVPRIRNGYGRVWLPPKITICSCDDISGWYRFRETDTLSNFQIEVDGRHNDQNSPTAGYRPPFFLQPFGATGGCRDFLLTYRTSATRPYSPNTTSAPGNAHSVTVTIDLQKSSQNQTNPGTAPTGGWSTVDTFVVTGSVWRTIRRGGFWDPNGDPISFNSCTNQNNQGTNSLTTSDSEGQRAPVEGESGATTDGGDTPEVSAPSDGD